MFVEPRVFSNMNNVTYCAVPQGTSRVDLQNVASTRVLWIVGNSRVVTCYAMIFVLSLVAKCCYSPKQSTCSIFYWNFEYVQCNFIMRDVNALTQENALVTVKL